MRKWSDLKFYEVVEIFTNAKGFKTGVECDKCGGELVIRIGLDKFLGCSNYPKCTHKEFQMKMNYSQPTSFLWRQTYHPNNYCSHEDYEDIMNGAYLNGIHCADDM